LSGINRQTYYRRQRQKKEEEEMVKTVINQVQTVRKQMPRLGTRKLYHILHAPLRELGVGRDKLFSIMKSNDMQITPKRNRRITTNSHHRFHKHKNRIEGIALTRPEQVWVADITYLGNQGVFCYLSLITDAYSKKIMGYDLSKSLATDGALRALQMAIANRLYPSRPLIHHSDRGIQYCCNEYQLQMEKNHIEVSMTESYDPYANAVAERINGILKQEFLLEEYGEISMDTLNILLKDSIRVYNTLRPHASCLMNTPQWMHRQESVKIKTYKKTSGITCKATPCK
jgi:transposase InsO family protein